MKAALGLLVAICGVFIYSASGWLYGADQQIRVTGLPGKTKLVQQNFDPFNQRSIRKHISECLKDGYQYLAMSMFFDQAEVALPGFHKMFKEYYDREMANALSLMNYMNLREGAMKLTAIPEPKTSLEWEDGETALQAALRMEKKANTKFLTLLQLAVEKHDPHLKQFVEGKFLDQKVMVIKELGDKITQLKKYKLEDPGLGLQMFDSSMLK